MAPSSPNILEYLLQGSVFRRAKKAACTRIHVFNSDRCTPHLGIAVYIRLLNFRPGVVISAQKPIRASGIRPRGLVIHAYFFVNDIQLKSDIRLFFSGPGSSRTRLKIYIRFLRSRDLIEIYGISKMGSTAQLQYAFLEKDPKRC